MNYYEDGYYRSNYGRGYGRGYSNYGRDYSCYGRCDGDDIRKALMRNNGKVVTVYTVTGGRDGFTGLVAKVDGDSVKLITSIPSAPFEKMHKHDHEGDCNFNLCEHCRCSHFGSSIIIPICKITAVSEVEI